MVHIGKIIETEFRKQERTVTWLAKKLYCDRSTIYAIFQRPSIDTHTLLQISRILNHNFFNYYLQELNKCIKTPTQQ